MNIGEFQLKSLKNIKVVAKAKLRGQSASMPKMPAIELQSLSHRLPAESTGMQVRACETA